VPKPVSVTLTRAQAQAVVALLTGNLTTGELRPVDGVDRALAAESVAALMDALTTRRPVVRWQKFEDKHGAGWRLLCDLDPLAVARQTDSGVYRCVLVGGPEPARLGDYATLREARGVALAEFTARARAGREHAAAS
jgi:hypothetical protein